MFKLWPNVVLSVALALATGTACLHAGESVPPPPPPPGPDVKTLPPPVEVEPLKTVTPINAKPPKEGSKINPTDVMSDLDWSASKQSFLQTDKGAVVVLSGSAWIRYSGVKLEADNLVVYRDSKEFYAEGHIRLRIGESEMHASSAYIDVASDSGFLVDAVIKVTAPSDALGPKSKGSFGIPQDKPPELDKEDAERRAKQKYVSPEDNTNRRDRDPYGVYVDSVNDPQARASLVVKADKLIRHSKLHFSAENGFVTNDEMAHPIYGVKAGTVDLLLHEVPDPERPGKPTLKPEKVTVRKAQIQIMGFNLFPFPTVTYDLAKKREYISVHGGKSSRWGYYGLLRFGYGLGGSNDEPQSKLFEMRHIYVDVDEREKRGPGLGLEMGWQTRGYNLSSPGTERVTYERGSGHIRAYGEDELQIKTFDDIVRARQNLLRRIQLKLNGDQRVKFDANLLFLDRRRIDNAGPPSLALQTHEDDLRGLVDFSHHQPIRRMLGVDNVQLDFVYQRESDRDYRLEYEPHNYNSENPAEALASMRKATDNWSAEFLFRTNPQTFDSSPPRSPFDYGTFTGYEPALTYTRVPTEIGCSSIFMSGEVQAARMHRYFEREIYDQPSFTSDRLYGNVDFARPFKWYCVNFTPHLGAQGMLYDNSRDTDNNFVGRNEVDGDALAQGALKYGFDIDSRIYGTFCDLENDALGIKGFRHIVEPKLSYRGISSTTNDPKLVPDFDDIDNLRRRDVITFSFEQTAQTRRPNREGSGDHAVSIAGFDTALDYYPAHNDQKRLLDGDPFALLRVEGFMRVMDVMRFEGSLGVNPNNFDVEVANYGITVDPHERWRLKFDERFTYSDHARAIIGSDQYRIRFEYELSERWRLGVDSIHEQRSSIYQIKGRQVERIELTRHYGPFDASIAYSINRNLNEHGFYGSVRPTVVYRNLILPENDPLVNPSDLSGDFEEPEMRNYDPFEILRKSRMGKKRKDKPEYDVPAPPPPTTQADKPAPAEVTQARNLLNPTKPVAKKAPVDADDWTVPASVPATARDK